MTKRFFTHRPIAALGIDKSTKTFDKKVLPWSYDHFAYNWKIIALTRVEEIDRTFLTNLNLTFHVDIC